MNKSVNHHSLTARLTGEHTPPPAFETPSAAEMSIVPIHISQIEPYLQNPRLYDNPKFDTIKESIRERGVLQRLIVTKRPGADIFTLCQGGNTRLKCLQELYKETSDPKFGTVYCELRPWRDETDLMVGHVVENELRGNLNWHERSRMTLTLHKTFSELSGSTLSAHEFKRLMQSKGVTVVRQHIGLHRYTVEVLEPLLPNHLRTDLGRPMVERIMKTDQVLKSIWDSAEMPAHQYGEIFEELLRELDKRKEFVYTSFLGHFCQHLSEKLLTPRAYLQNAVDEYFRFSGDLPTIDGMPRETPPTQTDPLASINKVRSPVPIHSKDTIPETPVSSNGYAVYENDAPRNSRRRPANEPDFMDGERVIRRAAARTEALRENIYRLANLFEIATGNRGCIAGMKLGYGYIVLHLPQDSDRSESELIVRDQAWWMLQELSAIDEGLSIAPKLIIDYANSHRTQLTRWLESVDLDVLEAIAQKNNMRLRSPLRSVSDLVRRLDARSLKLATEFMVAVQRLEHHYVQTKTDPWKTFAEQPCSQLP